MSDFYKAYWEHVMPKVTTYPSASTTTFVCHATCGHCGGNHLTDRCPYVKAIEYHENGQVKRIEFYPRPPDARPLTITVSITFTFTPDSDELVRAFYYAGSTGSQP